MLLSGFLPFCVLLSSILWPYFYWPELSRSGRVLALGLPCALLNMGGWIYNRHGSRVNAIVFLLTGCLLLPLLVGVILTEYDLLRAPQTEEWELCGWAAVDPDSGPEWDGPAPEDRPEEPPADEVPVY